MGTSANFGSAHEIGLRFSSSTDQYHGNKHHFFVRKRRRDDEDPSRKKQRMSVPDLNKKAFNYGETKFGEKKTKRKDNFKF